MMNLSEVKGHLKRNGFARVNTLGGWIQLDEWSPYGGFPVSFRHIDFDRCRVFEQVPERDGFVSGVWEFGR